jgi:hypothetical protein
MILFVIIIMRTGKILLLTNMYKLYIKKLKIEDFLMIAFQTKLFIKYSKFFIIMTLIKLRYLKNGIKIIFLASIPSIIYDSS